VTSTGPPGLEPPLAWLVTQIGLARLALGLLGWRVIWRDCSCARQHGMTSIGPLGLVSPLAQLVTPIGLA
jgi:hypothetical protein